MEKENKDGKGVGFERIRRVTGYLAGDVKRFNNAKREEEKARVKHTGIKEVVSDKDSRN
jgi:anaerobic ribonucleoside-triphosphate reductase